MRTTVPPAVLGYLAALCLAPAPASAQDLVVKPYLVLGSDRAVHVLWEGAGATVEALTWSCGDGPEHREEPTATATLHGTLLAETILDELEPGATCHYRVGDGVDRAFPAPPEPAAGDGVRLVLLADTQHDAANPDKLREVVEDGALSLLDAPADAALLTGDLVDDGTDHAQWVDEFFPGIASLAAGIPLLPVLGNHDANSDLFHAYFPLPPHPDVLYQGHHYAVDLGNVRVVGMDTSVLYLSPAALEWLDGVLEEAAATDTVDFVVLQGHHPYHSELWPPGETPGVAGILSRLEAFARTSGKPALHLFGHTHGWSRGQSRDAPVFQVNTSTASGNPDYWGEYGQQDYPEFSVTHDDWGFALLTATPGPAATLQVTRYSRGNELEPLDNVVRDRFTVRRGNRAPALPEIRTRGEVDPACPVLVASPACDPDGDAVGHARWQVAATCDDLDTPLLDEVLSAENWYFGEDTRAGDHLGVAVLSPMPAGASFCARVQYRDAGLAWSPWSEPVTLATAAAADPDGTCVAPPYPYADEDVDCTRSDDLPDHDAPACGCSTRTGRPTAPLAFALALAACLRRRPTGRGGSPAPGPGTGRASRRSPSP